MGKLGLSTLMAVALFLYLAVLGVQGIWSQGLTNFGDPLLGAPSSLFQDGKDDFAEVEGVQDGLGPIFNGRSCAECHNVPAVGGSSSVTETRFASRSGDLPGGSLLQKFATRPECQEVIPPEATIIAQRLTTALFGAGLIEAIPDGTIQAQADQQSRSGDGIHGRPNIVFDVATNQSRVGRFGWKAQQATLLAFSGDAYLNEMGITNDLFPQENAPNGDRTKLQACDTVREPEDVRHGGLRGIDRFTNFMRFLAPPPRGALTAQVLLGEAIFSAIGCAVCHTPVMLTGTPVMLTGDNLILALRQVPLFSDLLLHDVGTGDGIAQAGAGPDELRTPPLWGLRVRPAFLHDGSALTIEAAIRAHAGEAKGVMARFQALSPAETQHLLAFLNSL
jgi:CxxC motif-containing protein (DUF1111 family)